MSPIKRTSATAVAPGSVGNVAVGFDCLGFAIEGICDTVTVSLSPDHGKVEIDSMEGPHHIPINLPSDPERNTATAGLVRLLRDLANPFGFKVRISKGIPLGSGMGGSAASAVAGIVAANALLPKPLAEIDLMKYALIGERVASGAKHGDNVAPSLFGGLVLVTEVEPPCVVKIPVPKNLYAVVVHPPIVIETRAARAMLKLEVPLKSHVQQLARLGGFIAGCYRGDLQMIQQNLVDGLIEPQRASLIKGFQQVKTAALNAGALGCSISGSGPAVFALVHDEQVSGVSAAMLKAFEAVGVKGAKAFETFLQAPGARVLEG